MIWLNVPYLMETIERVMICYPVSWIVVSILFIIYYKTGDIYGERRTAPHQIN